MIITIFKAPSNKTQMKEEFIFCNTYTPDTDWKLRLSLLILKTRFID